MKSALVPTWKEWLGQHPEWREEFRGYYEPSLDSHRQFIYDLWREECERARRTPAEEDGFPYHYTLPEE